METTKAAAETPSRVFIACARCKTVKRKCDGNTPRCSNCVTHDAECIYAPARRMRGPGKKGRIKESRETNPDVPGPDASAAKTGDPPPPTNWEVDLPRTRLNGRRPESLFAPLLVSTNFAQVIGAFRAEVQAVAAGGFSPLMPLDVMRSLVEAAFADVIPEPRLVSRARFMRHLEAQHADDAAGPGSDVARWALVNGVTALAGRFKTAPGAEPDIYPIVTAFYRNAVAVVRPLLAASRARPALLAVQALLALAIFARGIPDPAAFGMLVRSAARLLETLAGTRPWADPALPSAERDEFAGVCCTARQLGEEAREITECDVYI